MTTSEFAPCPRCGNANAKRVNYTWWGGALGPRLFTHVKCQTCGATYNGNTGQSNTTAIIIYSVVLLVIAIVLFSVLL